MSDTSMNRDLNDTTDEHVPASEVAGAHESDGTLGRVSGTGSGAIAGGIVGAAVAGPLGAVVGAVAGGALGAAAGDAAHSMGDDHDDVNVETGSGGDLGRYSGSGAGAVSGAIVGGAAGGPLGAVAGSVAGGMLGAEAGDAAKDMGGTNHDAINGDPIHDSPIHNTSSGASTGSTSGGTGNVSGSDALLAGVPGVVTGIPGAATPVSGSAGAGNTGDYNPGLPQDTRDIDNSGVSGFAGGTTSLDDTNTDTRGTMERLSNTGTGDLTNDNIGVVTDADGRPLTGNASGDTNRDDRTDTTPRTF